MAESSNNLDLSTSIGPNKLETPCYNASGCLCATKKELDALAESEAGAIVTKSCTKDDRTGNVKPRYYEWTVGSINSMGLPNKGYDFYADEYELPDEEGCNKPYFISIAGSSQEEAIELMLTYIRSREKANIELNVSCPNIEGKPQLGYDFEGLASFLGKIHVHIRKLLGEGDIKNKICIGLKMVPYFDPVHFDMAADIIRDNKDWISFITCINSIGNGLMINVELERPEIKPKGGLGGVGGLYCKPTALANVYQFYQRLRDDDISIIGCGGVHCGSDVFEHILCGATAVQVGTCLIGCGPELCFKKLNKQLEEIMEKKGYTSLDEFRGSLLKEN